METEDVLQMNYKVKWFTPQPQGTTILGMLNYSQTILSAELKNIKDNINGRWNFTVFLVWQKFQYP